MSNQPAIPTVRFADPTVLQKLGLPQVPSQVATPQSQNDFNLQPPTVGLAPSAPAIMPEQSIPQQPILDTFEAPKYQAQPQEQPEVNTTNPNPASKPRIDSPNPVFNEAYSSLSDLQRKIVDDMVTKLNMRDLFTKKRLELSHEIIPGSLVVKYVSPTQDELSEMWEAMSDLKGNQAFIELRLNLKYCSRIVGALNNSVLPEDLEAREKLLGGFDGMLIQVISDYGRLFDLARTKFLHRSYIEQNPT